MCAMNAARILVVDDELSLRRLMRLYLTRAGFTVEEASTGNEALAALRRGGIDLAIVDVMLPEIDGFEVVRQARRNSSIPIILLTARGEEASRVAEAWNWAPTTTWSNRFWRTRWSPGFGRSCVAPAGSRRTPTPCGRE